MKDALKLILKDSIEDGLGRRNCIKKGIGARILFL